MEQSIARPDRRCSPNAAHLAVARLGMPKSHPATICLLAISSIPSDQFGAVATTAKPSSLPPAIAATPFHLGPWLLPGLIPFGVGVALTTSYYLEQSTQVSNEENPQNEDKVIPMKDHLDKERRERSL